MSDYSITPETAELLAMRVIDLLMEQDMMEDTVLYANGSAFYGGELPGGILCLTPEGRQISRFPCPEEDIPGEFKGAVTATFEGNRLFQEMNHGSGQIQEQLNALFSPCGLYLERGYEWNFYAKAGD